MSAPAAAARVVVLLAATALATAPAAGQDVALVEVPASLPAAQREALAARRAVLMVRRDSLNARIGAFDARCGHATASPNAAKLARACQTAAGPLVAQRDALAARKRAFNAEVVADLDARIDQLEGQIARDQRELSRERVGFQERGEEIASWDSLSSDARAELESEATNEICLRFIQAARRMELGAIASLNPPKANAMISELRAAGVTDSRLFAAIRSVAGARGKPQLAHATEKLLDRLDEARSAGAEAGRGETLKALATVLGMWLDNPELKTLTADVDLTTAAVYNNATRRVSVAQVDRLTALNERDLLVVHEVSVTLRAHVRELLAARKDLATLDASGQTSR